MAGYVLNKERKILSTLPAILAGFLCPVGQSSVVTTPVPLEGVFKITVYVADGTTLGRSAADSPLTYVVIAQVTSIGSVGRDRSLIDVTNLSSAAREYKKAIVDGQELTIVIQYDPDDTGHAALLADVALETTLPYQVTFTDSPAQTVSFNGLVKNFTVNGIGIDEVLTANVVIKPSGALTFA